MAAEEGLALSELRRKAEVQLKAPHSAERILRCWGGQAAVTFTSIQDSISKILQARLSSWSLPDSVAKHCSQIFAAGPYRGNLQKQGAKMRQ